jgi:hypothetical protein
VGSTSSSATTAISSSTPRPCVSWRERSADAAG